MLGGGPKPSDSFENQFWSRKEYGNISPSDFNPETIPDRLPGSIPNGMDDWPDEKQLQESKAASVEKISSLQGTPCYAAAVAFFNCHYNGLEQHNPNYIRDCMDEKLELKFCVDDMRKQEKQVIEQRLDKDELKRLRGIIDEQRQSDLTEEAKQNQQRYEDVMKEIRNDFEARKARRAAEHQERFETHSTERGVTKKKSWWRFGF